MRTIACACMLAAMAFACRREAAERASSRAPTRADEARATLNRIARASQSLMPPGYEAVPVTLPLEQLRRIRPAVHRDPTSQPGAADVWTETDASGAHVMYRIGARGRMVTEVQFASDLDSQAGLETHRAALRARYGTPTATWHCPASRDAPAMQRITWQHDDATVMEASLLHGRGVAVTLIIAPTADVARAIDRAHCTAP